MNIHLPAILMFTRGIGFLPIPIFTNIHHYLYLARLARSARCSRSGSIPRPIAQEVEPFVRSEDPLENMGQTRKLWDMAMPQNPGTIGTLK